VAPGALAHPLAAVIAFNVIWIGWQLPAAFDTARADSGLALLEHATYVAGGLLLWLQLIGSRPLVPAAPPLRRAALLIGTVGVGTILGMVLVFGSGVVYPAYGGSAHQVMTVLDDQQLAGAVLWMGMLPPMILAGVTILMRWLSDEESADLSAGLDRMLSPRKSSWPTRSGVR
jgi:putative copper resistance protein D